MNTKTMRRLFFVVAFVGIFLVANETSAEKTLPLQMGQEPRCESLMPSGKPDSGGFEVENIWVQKTGIIKHVYDDDQGKICFEPVSVGSTRVKITGMVYEVDRNQQLKSSKRFYRNYRVRVRP
jgi:hypothetical protein